MARVAGAATRALGRISRPVRIFALLGVLILSIVWLIIPPPAEFDMEGHWGGLSPPAGVICPIVDPTARAWTFELPPEASVGLFVVQDALGNDQCRVNCLVKHRLAVKVVEWKARAGFFSGYSEVVFDAELLRTGAQCEDRTSIRGSMAVDQGSRGDPMVVASALGRWALEYFRNNYDRLYGEPEAQPQ